MPLCFVFLYFFFIYSRVILRFPSFFILLLPYMSAFRHVISIFRYLSLIFYIARTFTAYYCSYILLDNMPCRWALIIYYFFLMIILWRLYAIRHYFASERAFIIFTYFFFFFERHYFYLPLLLLFLHVLILFYHWSLRYYALRRAFLTPLLTYYHASLILRLRLFFFFFFIHIISPAFVYIILRWLHITFALRLPLLRWLLPPRFMRATSLFRHWCLPLFHTLAFAFQPCFFTLRRHFMPPVTLFSCTSCPIPILMSSPGWLSLIWYTLHFTLMLSVWAIRARRRWHSRVRERRYYVASDRVVIRRCRAICLFISLLFAILIWRVIVATFMIMRLFRYFFDEMSR